MLSSWKGGTNQAPPFQHDAPQAASPIRRLSREREAEEATAAPRLLPLLAGGRLRTPYLSSGRELASGEKDVRDATLLVFALFLAGRFALTFPCLSS